jgi:mannose-6-phosphate isomerase
MAVLVFAPIAMERVWGGRLLETHFHRPLPDADAPYGESWEVVDRAEAQSVVVSGPYAGMTLHELWSEKREEIFGVGLPLSERFPLLVKILDARADLSIQVHPPAALAAQLKGDPKTEMWYIAAAQESARLVVGLRKDTTHESFAAAIENGSVADLVHEIPVSKGDSIFIPSGRLHAIGAGLLIFEIQQNSDTTYRVFDWNRVGLDGKARELHIAESLASIDFSDVEPELDAAQGAVIASCEHFVVERFTLAAGDSLGLVTPDRFSLLHVVEGAVLDSDGVSWPAGTSLLLPRGEAGIIAEGNATILRSSIP